MRRCSLLARVPFAAPHIDIIVRVVAQFLLRISYCRPKLDSHLHVHTYSLNLRRREEPFSRFATSLRNHDRLRVEASASFVKARTRRGAEPEHDTAMTKIPYLFRLSSMLRQACLRQGCVWLIAFGTSHTAGPHWAPVALLSPSSPEQLEHLRPALLGVDPGPGMACWCTCEILLSSICSFRVVLGIKMRGVSARSRMWARLGSSDTACAPRHAFSTGE